VETPPVRPAAYYLLGQLREKQKRYGEAYDAYQKALEMDPGYLDVMKNLYDLKRKVKRPDSDWVVLQTQMLRLDPLLHHLGFDGNDILDWASFWVILNDALKKLPKPLEAVFPLTANIKHLETKTPDREGRGSRRYFGNYAYNDRSTHATAADVLIQSNVARCLSEMDAKLASRDTALANKGQMPGEDEDDDDEEEDDDDEK